VTEIVMMINSNFIKTEIVTVLSLVVYPNFNKARLEHARDAF
jgi:hypothetical protein